MIKYSFLVLPIEKLLERAGNAETYQIRCLILFSIQWLFSSIIFFGYNLLLLQPPIHCYNNTSPEVFQCTEEEACSGIYFYRFDVDTVDSLVSEFNLICERKVYIQLCDYAFYIGSFLGALYYTTVIQNKGRLFVITQTTTLIGTMLLISLVSVHIYINAAVFFLVAFGIFGLLNASINYFVEISGGPVRLLGPNCFLFGWGFGQLFLSIFSKTFSGWQTITLCIMGLPMIVIALFFRFMKESPRFLVTQEKFEDAKNSLRNIAKINGRSMPDFSFESEMRQGLFPDSYMFVQNEMKPSVTPAQKKEKSILTLFRYETLKTSTWAILVFFTILIIDSHGNKLALNHFADDIHESLILAGIAQMFGYLLACYFATNSNRRPVVGFAFLAIGLVYIIFYSEGILPENISVETDTGLTIVLLVLGKVAVCVALGTLYNVVIESFPTNMRHFSFGLFYCISQLGLFLLMLVEERLGDMGLSPIIVLGLVNIVLVFLTRYMDETLNKRITDYIREEDELLLSFEMRERE